MFKNISKVNKIWKLLNESYLNTLDGKIGNTVIKIDEKGESIDYLLVQSDNESVKKILTDNEQDIIKALKSKYDISIMGINII